MVRSPETARLPIPGKADEIDAAWLGRALKERFPGVSIRGVEVLETHEATNAHARLRLETVPTQEGTPAHPLPDTLFAKLLPEHPDTRPRIVATGMGVREARFYAQLADTLSMRTPRAFAALHADDGAFVILLEDLVTSGCEIPDGSAGLALDPAAAALEDLANLHRRFADSWRRRSEAAWVEAPLHDPLYAGRFFRVALSQHRDRLTRAFVEVAELYLARADALHALWQRGEHSVVHGDPHLGNLFLDAGRVGFLDWGLIHLGPPLRDASYFLCMALDVESRRANERDLLRHYSEVLGAGRRDRPEPNRVWRQHRELAAYTVIASCQIVSFPASISPARRVFSEAFLARAEAAVEDLESAAALREALES